MGKYGPFKYNEIFYCLFVGKYGPFKYNEIFYCLFVGKYGPFKYNEIFYCLFVDKDIAQSVRMGFLLVARRSGVVQVAEPWGNMTVVRFMPSLKFYHDFSCGLYPEFTIISGLFK